MGWGSNKGNHAGAAADAGKGPSYSKIHPPAVPGWQVQAMMNQAAATNQLQQQAALYQPFEYYEHQTKGLGKGKGKHQNNECFTCKHEDCWAARGKKPTYNALACFTCKRPKNVALNPKLEEMTEWAYKLRLGATTQSAAAPAAPVASSGKTHDKKKGTSYTAKTDDQLAALKAERAAEVAAAKAPDSLLSQGPSLAQQTKGSSGTLSRTTGMELAFSAERILADFKILVPVLQPLTDSLKADQMPPTLVARPPQDSFDHFVEEARKLDPKGPGARAEIIENLEKEIKKIQSALSFFGKGRRGDDGTSPEEARQAQG